MAKYQITSDAGAEFASRTTSAVVEVGETVDLTLGNDQEQAVVAAGWLEHAPAKTTKDKE